MAVCILKFVGLDRDLVGWYRVYSRNIYSTKRLDYRCTHVSFLFKAAGFLLLAFHFCRLSRLLLLAFRLCGLSRLLLPALHLCRLSRLLLLALRLCGLRRFLLKQGSSLTRRIRKKGHEVNTSPTLLRRVHFWENSLVREFNSQTIA